MESINRTELTTSSDQVSPHHGNRRRRCWVIAIHFDRLAAAVSNWQIRRFRCVRTIPWANPHFNAYPNYCKSQFHGNMDRLSSSIWLSPPDVLPAPIQPFFRAPPCHNKFSSSRYSCRGFSPENHHRSFHFCQFLHHLSANHPPNAFNTCTGTVTVFSDTIRRWICTGSGLNSEKFTTVLKELFDRRHFPSTTRAANARQSLCSRPALLEWVVGVEWAAGVKTIRRESHV